MKYVGQAPSSVPKDDVDALEERPRCELDHVDGGVCQRLLTPSGTCPGEADHQPERDLVNDIVAFLAAQQNRINR